MLAGSLVALVTPMDASGNVEWDKLAELVEKHIAAGTHGIVAVGTTGESATLDVKEHCDVITRIVEVAAGRLPVIAGTGANSTREAIELTAAAKQAKADACLLVTPYYNKPTQEGLYQHYKLIAESVAIPQILYNVPGRTACDMLPETIARLSVLDNIIAVKEATGDIERGRQIRTLCDDDFILLSGDDGTYLELMEVGAKGNISVTANVAPEQMAAACNAALAGDFEQANALNRPLQELHKTLFCQSSPIPVKWAMHQMGWIGPGIRLPLTPLSEEYFAVVRSALAEAGINI